jgi:dolichyl-phosphate beta-glucosyltransferase
MAETEPVYDLTVIIPAYNEHHFIARTIQALTAYLTERFATYEIILVDDGSNDSTNSVIDNIHLKLPKGCSLKFLVNATNSGKGFSIRRGVLESSGRVVVFVDADLPYDLEAIDLISKAISRGADLAIGSRLVPGAEIHTGVPMVRSITGRAFNLLVQTFLFKGIPDTQCGIKGFSRTAAKDIFPHQTINNFGFDVELLFIAKLRNCKIEQIPVKLINYRKESRVNIWRDSIRMMKDILHIRKNGMNGRYNGIGH